MGKRFRYHSKSKKRFQYHSRLIKDFHTTADLVVAVPTIIPQTSPSLLRSWPSITVAIGDEVATQLDYINLAVALYSVVPSSSLLIIMASLHELRDMPVEGDYFLSFDNLLEVIRDASVKHKFSSQGTTQRLKKSAVSMYQQGLSMACECLFEFGE